jgi:hypothetical protein
MKRVLYILCAQNDSGAELVMERLMLFNVEKVTPVALCPPGTFAQRVAQNGIKVITTRALLSLERPSDNPYSPAFLFKLATKLLRAATIILHTIRTEQIDIVHANAVSGGFYSLLPCLISRICKPFSQVKWLWTAHNVAFRIAQDTKIADACCRTYDATVAVSGAVQQQYAEFGKKVSLIYNGLDEDVFRFRTSAPVFSTTIQS